MLRHRWLLALAMVFAVLSAGGLGAGILGVQAVLGKIIGTDAEQSQGLRDLARGTLDSLATYHIVLPASWTSWIDRLSNKPFDAVLAIVITLGVLTMLGAAANFLHAYCSLTVVARTIANIRRAAFRRAVHLPLRTIIEIGPADTVSRIVYDSTTLAAGFTALVSKAVAQLTKGVVCLVVACVLDWRMFFISLGVGVVLAVIIRKLGKRIRRASRSALASQGRLYRATAEVMNGLRVVKAFTAERDEAGRFHRINKEVVRQELRARTARALSSPLIETLALFVLGALSLVAMKAIIEGHLDKKEFFTVLGALGLAAGSLKPLVGLYTDIQQSGAAADRLHDLLAREVEPGHGHRLPRLPRHAKSIEFQNVSFTYPAPAPSQPGLPAPRPALDNVSLTIRHGEVVAFVGPNGCGKTTLLSLIPRFVDPATPTPSADAARLPAVASAHSNGVHKSTGRPAADDRQGRVLIDGLDIRDYSVRSLRRQIGVVTQDTVLFEGTIRSNIAYGDVAGRDHDPAIAAAARRARAEDFILDKPGRYDAPIGENGVGLSGGQRQRLTIARAILRDPAILILDEATSMIDAESEARIAEAIDEFVSPPPSPHGAAPAPKRTCLIVAHRLSTVLSADRIVVMDQGRVIDDGTHDELLGRCEIYRLIASNQLVRAAPPRDE
ncbi:MAG: ABC transporter ATP-binding protein [Phycisphaerales bacterium]